MFIQTEATPNPATLKFLPGRPVLETGTLDMPTKDAAAQSPLAAKLFEVPNVGAVFFGSDFIAVTKTDGEWQQLKPAILGAIMEHYMSGTPLLSGDASLSDTATDEFFDAKDADTVATIKDLIETRVRPAVRVRTGAPASSSAWFDISSISPSPISTYALTISSAGIERKL